MTGILSAANPALGGQALVGQPLPKVDIVSAGGPVLEARWSQGLVGAALGALFIAVAHSPVSIASDAQGAGFSVVGGIRDATRLFVERLSRIRQIEHVVSRVEDGIVKLWAIIDQPDVNVENQVYDTQLTLMDDFPETLFDFYIIFRQGRSLDEVNPAGTTRLFDRA